MTSVAFTQISLSLPLGDIAISQLAPWGHGKCHLLDHNCYWTLVLDPVGN